MIKGEKITLRACEPNDINFLYKWENDYSLWHITNTYIPFSKSTLIKYLESIQDIYTDKQLRLIIEVNAQPVGMIDLFDYEPFHSRAGIGILIADEQNRSHGLATDALSTLKTYCKNTLGIRLLFCNILITNEPSIRLFEKSGFKKCGIKPKWHKQGDEFVDELIYQAEL